MSMFRPENLRMKKNHSTHSINEESRILQALNQILNFLNSLSSQFCNFMYVSNVYVLHTSHKLLGSQSQQTKNSKGIFYNHFVLYSSFIH